MRQNLSAKIDSRVGPTAQRRFPPVVRLVVGVTALALAGVIAAGFIFGLTLMLALLVAALLAVMFFGRARMQVFLLRRRPASKSRSHAEVLTEEDDSTRS